METAIPIPPTLNPSTQVEGPTSIQSILNTETVDKPTDGEQPPWYDITKLTDEQLPMIEKELSEAKKQYNELMNEKNALTSYIALLEDKTKCYYTLEQELHDYRKRNAYLEAERSHLVQALEQRIHHNHISQMQLMQPPMYYAGTEDPNYHMARSDDIKTEKGSDKDLNSSNFQVNIDLETIRQNIPEHLHSGYVIHAFLCCVVNRLGAEAVFESGDRRAIESVNISSFWTLKIYCLFIIKHILKKKTSVTCSGDWDKSLKQRWFDGWTQKESFTVVPKPGRKELIAELLQGHKELKMDDKSALLEQVQRWCDHSGMLAQKT